MARKAIAYVSDVILGRSGEVVSRESQRLRIQQYAQEHDIEIEAWFEDSTYSERLAERHGMRELLASEVRCDCLLVERVWCLSRNLPDMRLFLGELDQRGLRLESATLLWDCVSQMARQHYRSSAVPRRAPAPVSAPDGAAAKVDPPARLHFAGLKRSPNYA